MMKKFFFIFLMMFCLAGKALCFPALTGRVVDEANLLSYSQKERLEQLLQQAEPHQVVAVSLRSLDGKEIEEYGYQLGRHWGIGRKDINDGVLVLIAPNQRQLRIEVGYGLEGTLTDTLSSRIVNRIMLPLARQGKYAEALIEGSQAVLKTLKGEKISFSQYAKQSKDEEFSTALKMFLGIFITAVIFIVIVFLFIVGYAHARHAQPNVSDTIEAKSVSVDDEEPTVPVTENDWKKSKEEQKKFLINLIPLVCFFGGFYIIAIVSMLVDFVVGILLLVFSTMLFLSGLSFFTSAWRAYHTNKYFPMREWYKLGFSDGSKHSGNNSFHGSSHGSSSGGSSFSGGGGSFGGGGSSGRW